MIMALDIINTILGLSSTNWILLFIVFILFVLAMKKVFRIVMNSIWIVLAAFLFPLAANRVLGLAVPTDIDSILLLATAGLGLYFVYLVVKSVYTIVSFAGKVGRKMVPTIGVKGKGKGRDRNKTESAEREVRDVKLAKAEKPKLGEPVPKQFFTSKGRQKSEKEIFKNYVVLEDTSAGGEGSFTARISGKINEKASGEADSGRDTEDRGDYVELEEVGHRKEHGVEEVEVEKEEYVDLAAEKGAKIERLREIKHRKKRRGGRK
jgi:hypothetical protein